MKSEYWTENLKKWLVVGKPVYEDFGEGHPNSGKSIVVSIVDDDVIVSKSFSKKKKRWYYKCEPIFWYYLLDEQGRLKGEIIKNKETKPRKFKCIHCDGTENVEYTEDIYESEINGDYTKRRICKTCNENGARDI